MVCSFQIFVILRVGGLFNLKCFKIGCLTPFRKHPARTSIFKGNSCILLLSLIFSLIKPLELIPKLIDPESALLELVFFLKKSLLK